MVKYEILNEKLCKHYSDDNKMIHKIGTGEIYSEAIDVIPCKYIYEETDIDIKETCEEEQNG